MKKVTFKEFFATLFGGIWQAVKWLVGMCGYKDGNGLVVVLKRIFALCITILLSLFTFAIVYAFATEVVYQEWIRPYTSDRTWNEKHLSNHIVHQRMYYSNECRVYDKRQKKVVQEDVNWVIPSDDKDAPAVFARNGKRGFLNRFTGEVVIPEIYTRAWVFSEGLAAVEKDGELVFIDTMGKVVIDRDFQVCHDDPEYAFRNGYCKMKDPVTGLTGLIDHNGDWALLPGYDHVCCNAGFWQTERDGCVGLFTATLDTLFAVNERNICITDSIIHVVHADYSASRYDFAGNVLVDFVISGVGSLQYETGELRNEVSDDGDLEMNNKVYAVANRGVYWVYNPFDDNHYGLISRDGKRITPPLYTSIEAIDKNRYLCLPHGIIVDDSGRAVE